jgi:hypothetical protein
MGKQRVGLFYQLLMGGYWINLVFRDGIGYLFQQLFSPSTAQRNDYAESKKIVQ